MQREDSKLRFIPHKTPSVTVLKIDFNTHVKLSLEARISIMLTRIPDAFSPPSSEVSCSITHGTHTSPATFRWAPCSAMLACRPERKAGDAIMHCRWWGLLSVLCDALGGTVGCVWGVLLECCGAAWCSVFSLRSRAGIEFTVVLLHFLLLGFRVWGQSPVITRLCVPKCGKYDF